MSLNSSFLSQFIVFLFASSLPLTSHPVNRFQASLFPLLFTTDCRDWLHSWWKSRHGDGCKNTWQAQISWWSCFKLQSRQSKKVMTETPKHFPVKMMFSTMFRSYYMICQARKRYQLSCNGKCTESWRKCTSNWKSKTNERNIIVSPKLTLLDRMAEAWKLHKDD